MPAAIGRITYSKLGPWKGMNEKVSSDALPPGVAANVQNMLLDEIPGTAVKRQGTRALAALPSGLPPRDTYVFTKLDGTSYLLVSDGANLYYTTDPSSASFFVLIKAGLNNDGFMAFETAENKVWLSNGIDPVMNWDGTTLIIFDRTFTSTTNAVAVSSTTIQHAGLVQADDFWNGMKLVFTVGANIGTVVTITDFVAATDTLTFSPAISGTAVTDRWILGLEIPRGSTMRYYDGHMFIGNTADNQAELRFSEISDPDTGAVMNLDNPRAWPAENELALNVLDQEKLWGISPILRDRILIHKATGLFRLERDPLVIYRLEVVSRSVGSRFPDTWVENKNLLYFLGQDKDGLPEVYKTDMVDVSLVDPDGGVEPTLRDLQQPNAVQKNRIFTAQADFDAGTKSTLVSTESGQLGVGAFDTDAEWQGANLVSASNVDTETTPGKVALLGVPVWGTRYEADALPQNAVPAWTVQTGKFTPSVGGGILHLAQNALVVLSTDHYVMSLPGVLTSGKDTFFTIKTRIVDATGGFQFDLRNGQYTAEIFIGATTFFNGVTIPSVYQDNAYHVFTMLLKANGSAKLWADGVLVASSTTQFPTGSNEVKLEFFGSTGSLLSYDVDYAYLHADFKGDSLSGFGGKVSPTSLPSTLPASGNIVMLNDMTRTPDALRRVHQTSVLNGGTVSLESWTSDTVDFSSGTDGAGFVAVANGAVPGSALKRAQRIRTTLTRLDIGNAPELSALRSGVLWLSPSIQIGANIAAWRTFLDTIVVPATTEQVIKVRRATVAGTPSEGDFGAFFTIVNGDNIGTILGDVVPPASRWLQIKVEQGPGSAGELPYVDSMVAQWSEGSSANLPVRAIVHKKRYMICAATSISAANDIIIVCDRNDQWTKFIGIPVNAMVHYQSNLYGMNSGNANISQMDVSDFYNDYGNAIDAFLETREEDLGYSHLRKSIRYSYLHWDRAAAAYSMTTDYKRTGDTAYVGSVTFNFGTVGLDVRQNFPVATIAKRIQRRYRNAVVDQNMALMGETLYFDVRPPQP